MKRLSENDLMYLESIEQIETMVISGQITDEKFHNDMENVKNQF